MTPEDVAKAFLEGVWAEARFNYDKTGHETERYIALRSAVARHMLETSSDAEFNNYLLKWSQPFKVAAQEQVALAAHQKAMAKIVDTPETVAVIKKLEEKMHS